MATQIIRLLTTLLAINFSMQLVMSASNADLTQIEIDIDGDSEEKEMKDKRETDKLNQSKFHSRAGFPVEFSGRAIHYTKWWSSPVIERNDPPPEAG
ncbi:MAG: hypothetical protein RIM99_00905 [Cyclobacteriaceae bacterium]